MVAIHDQNVELVANNLQSGTEIGASVAEEIGAEQVILNNFPGSCGKLRDPGKDDSTQRGTTFGHDLIAFDSNSTKKLITK